MEVKARRGDLVTCGVTPHAQSPADVPGSGRRPRQQAPCAANTLRKAAGVGGWMLEGPEDTWSTLHKSPNFGTALTLTNRFSTRGTVGIRLQVVFGDKRNDSFFDTKRNDS